MSKTEVVAVDGWEVLDSRGTPTVACEVRLAGGAVGQASVPSGASTGRHEAVELRDGGDRYGGLGVLLAVGNVKGPLASAAVGADAADLAELDRALRAADGTPLLARLGSNAVLAVSVASAIAAAAAEGIPLYRWVAGNVEVSLPLPMVNVVSGGAHAGRAVDVQDVLVVPMGAASFGEALEWAWRVRRGTAEVAADRGLLTALVADEGGLGPPLPSNRAAMELVVAGIERAGLAPGEQVGLAIDVAANQLCDRDGYRFAAEDRLLTTAELVDEVIGWCGDYPIVSVEDVLAEDDWDGWTAATSRLRGVQVLGDDLFATDLRRLERGIGLGVANAVLVKPNQNGTVSGAEAVLRRARAAGYAPVVSARSGETEDAWLADLAVGWGAGQIKVGSTMRSERTAKWNRLLRIEAELGAAASFAGAGALGHGDRLGATGSEASMAAYSDRL
ncbi:MAG: phosphopyruvate hydratase [Actinobacteria bacterium]|nr:phosphopyruvate hydratase [Actinomycetota bacterium]